MIFNALAAIEEMDPHHLNAVCTKWRAIVRAQPRYWMTLQVRRPWTESLYLVETFGALTCTELRRNGSLE